MAAGADEADVIDKPGKAKVHEAKEAKADEADIVADYAETNDAGKADKTNEATVIDDANEAGADEADKTKADEADETIVANKIVAANEAIWF